MLNSLTLKNIATISDISIGFRSGLNVLTGETGAGKSILIDGLLLALGGRADRSIVRPGEKVASVEALFSSAEGEEHIVRREVRAQGRSRYFIDDELATLEEGRELVAGLVDLHTQGSTPALLSRRNQTAALDEYGGCRRKALEMRESFGRYLENLKRKSELEDLLVRSGDSQDLARHELDLIEKLDPAAEDYSSLLNERRELKAVSRGGELLNRVQESVSGDNGMVRTIRSFMSSLDSSGMDRNELIQLLEQAEIALTEAAGECENILSDIDSAPWRLSEIDQRLDGYSELLSRCGGSIDSLLGRRDELLARIAEYDEAENELRQLKKLLPEDEAALNATADELESGRKAAAERLEDAVSRELRLLGMPQAVFRVSMEIPSESRSCEIGGRPLSSEGRTLPNFIFSANEGMDPAPLSTVASGGEMSRISLVLKLALSDVSQAPTMVFDEIDSGVGGETANLLADSLSRVSGDRQVIVITHLPQIAFRAGRHMAVFKTRGDGIPVTQVRPLVHREERVDELARLLGGGPAALEHAEKMLSPSGGDGI